ncbi:Formylglycine-generating sulfatase enzyme [Botrimarina colliarenosi]|uniref:Formylglycine-generating sulfatase enzyme n=1 Tax=Botrimarina colliarenosi TaxID=2528001 RepID=A0A5C6A0U8_9BACT|nr:SUMF1/EgtB/PvdO family nonheme iron enzyme [Botrimarina colliarenosi]TWT93454.1 Formylglycine-generating sulfatase enzyme [Botrimarina colliarenosi]
MAVRSSATLVAAVLYAFLSPCDVRADWFGSGDNRFEIPFVTIGSPGNAADTTGAPNPAGRVDYTYRIGKYEVPEEAVRKANAQSLLDGAPLGITLDTRGPQKPATSLSWFEAARFVNWLNGDVGASPAYNFDASGEFQLWTIADPGYNAANPFRNTLAQYVLPSVDEWYKAAYYDPNLAIWWDYTTGSDTPPTPVAGGTDPGTAVWNQTAGPADVQLAGGESPFGTIGQGGNAWEFEETSTDLVNSDAEESRGVRGAEYVVATSPIGLSVSYRNSGLPPAFFMNVGFRIASVPEPASATLLFAALLFGRILPQRH